MHHKVCTPLRSAVTEGDSLVNCLVSVYPQQFLADPHYQRCKSLDVFRLSWNMVTAIKLHNHHGIGGKHFAHLLRFASHGSLNPCTDGISSFSPTMCITSLWPPPRSRLPTRKCAHLASPLRACRRRNDVVMALCEKHLTPAIPVVLLPRPESTVCNVLVTVSSAAYLPASVGALP